MPNSLQSHGLLHARLLCPPLSPGVCWNSCPLSWWYHSTISSFAATFSCCLQSFPASESFPMCQLFNSAGQSTGASASATVLPMNIQSWSPLGLTGLISLQSKWLSSFKSLLKHHIPIIYPYIPIRMAEIKSSHIKCCQGCETSETLIYQGWECIIVQPFWKKVEEFLQKLNICQYIIQPFLSLHIYLGDMKTYVPTEACTKHP